MTQPILEIDGLSKHFQLYEQNKLIPSCANVHLQVHTGQLTALIGPTGAGKSSVMKCVYRTYLPSSGRMIYRDGEDHSTDLAQASEHRMLELRQVLSEKRPAPAPVRCWACSMCPSACGACHRPLFLAVKSNASTWRGV